MDAYDMQVLALAAELASGGEMVKEALFKNLLGGRTRALRGQLKGMEESASQYIGQQSQRAAKHRKSLEDSGILGRMWHGARASGAEKKVRQAQRVLLKSQQDMGDQISKAKGQQLKSLVGMGVLVPTTLVGAPAAAEYAQSKGWLGGGGGYSSGYGY